MTDVRYRQLMGPDELNLTPEEIADNWHFCLDFDGLLMQGDPKLVRLDLVEDTCICGYEFPKPIKDQSL